MFADLASFKVYSTISHDAEQDSYQCTPMTQGLVPESLPISFKLPNIDNYAILGHTMIKMNREVLLTLNTTTLQYELKHSHRNPTTMYNLSTASLTPLCHHIHREFHTIPLS